jgi:hypothetical protein
MIATFIEFLSARRTPATITVAERSLGALQAASKALHRFVQVAMCQSFGLRFSGVRSSGASSGSQAENCGTCDDDRLQRKPAMLIGGIDGSAKSIALPSILQNNLNTTSERHQSVAQLLLTAAP